MRNYLFKRNRLFGSLRSFVATRQAHEVKGYQPADDLSPYPSVGRARCACFNKLSVETRLVLPSQLDSRFIVFW